MRIVAAALDGIVTEHLVNSFKIIWRQVDLVGGDVLECAGFVSLK